jgi:hypothetical protein
MRRNLRQLTFRAAFTTHRSFVNGLALPPDSRM